MADFALFIGFGIPARGRERQAAETFEQALHYYGQLQGQGQIEGFEAALLEPHGGDLGGFVLIRGDAAQLHRLRYEDQEFQRLTAIAQITVDNIGIVMAYTGNRLQQQIGRFMNEFAALR